MFLRNETGVECVLAKGRLTDDVAALSINLERHYHLRPDGRLEPIAPPSKRPEHFPPDNRRLVLWHGSSVTASGTVQGPASPPYRRDVTLTAKDRAYRLAVSGPRRWIRDRRGTLAPSAAEPFGAQTMSWQLAFGGSFEVSPGLDPATGLPHPGGVARHPLNPDGQGFYGEETAALGQPLPQIELSGDPQRTPLHRARPGCTAPCPRLSGMRVGSALDEPASPVQPGELSLGQSLEHLLNAQVLRSALRLQHAAPDELIFESLPPGSPVQTRGLGAADLEFDTPGAPVEVTCRRGRSRTALTLHLRHLHVDTDTRHVLAAFGFRHRYHPNHAPHWIEVHRRRSAS